MKNNEDQQWYGHFKLSDSSYTQEHPYRVFRRPLNQIVVKACPHYHDFFEIIVGTNGKGQVIIENNSFNLEDHSVIIVPCGFVHSIEAKESKRDKGSLIFLQVSFRCLNYYCNIENILKSMGCDLNLVPFVSKKYRPITGMVERLLAGNTNSTIYKIGLLLKIFNLFHQNNNVRNYTITDNSEKIKKVINWTNKNYHKKITLAQAGKVIGLSKYYFGKYFKRKTQFTYLDFLIFVRLNQSRLLLRRDLSVTEVCYQCGFQSLSYFTQLFKKQFKLSPKAFKKNCNL